MKWSKNKPKDDGYYWWRGSEKDTDPDIVEICNGYICEMRGDGYCEHQDFSGEWSEKILPPYGSECDDYMVERERK